MPQRRDSATVRRAKCLILGNLRSQILPHRCLTPVRDWSQADLDDRLAVSRQTINSIETGKYDPSLPLALKIGRLFDRRVEDIFDDNGDG